MRVRELAALMLLAALWGGSFLFIRVAAPVFGPVVLAALRVGIAGVALLAYAAVTRRTARLRGRLPAFLALGTLNAAIPYALIGAAELHLTASLAAILNATTPLFTALLAAATLRERLTGRVIAGLLAGVLGVAVLVGWSAGPVDATLLRSVAASLLAALSYAFAGVYAKSAFRGTPALTLAIGQQVGASLLLLPLAVPSGATGAVQRPSVGVGVAVLALAVLSTALAYLLYFFLIAHVGPTRTLSVTFLIPVFGLMWSGLFLREAVGPGTLIGLAIVLTSVVLVTGVRLSWPGRGEEITVPAAATREP